MPGLLTVRLRAPTTRDCAGLPRMVTHRAATSDAEDVQHRNGSSGSSPSELTLPGLPHSRCALHADLRESLLASCFRKHTAQQRWYESARRPPVHIPGDAPQRAMCHVFWILLPRCGLLGMVQRECPVRVRRAGRSARRLEHTRP